jgi:hypothetical protein
MVISIMRKNILVVALVVLGTVGAIVWFLGREGEFGGHGNFSTSVLEGRSNSEVGAATQGGVISGSAAFLTIAERSRMSDAARQQWLERLGQVPEDATEGDRDWYLAQQTSWWGKPVDSEAFWKDRVVWCDSSAQSAPRRHGRAYPPLPYEDANLPAYPNDEGIDWNSGVVEGPNLHFATSSKENAFWDRFGKTMPHPPRKVGA